MTAGCTAHIPADTANIDINIVGEKIADFPCNPFPDELVRSFSIVPAGRFETDNLFNVLPASPYHRDVVVNACGGNPKDEAGTAPRCFFGTQCAFDELIFKHIRVVVVESLNKTGAKSLCKSKENSNQ